MKSPIVRRDQVVWSAPPGRLAIISTGPLGYLGAAEEDCARWLGGFRRLLDGLQEPLQVVMLFRPGRQHGLKEEPRHNDSPAGGRAADLAFARELSLDARAQKRTVCLITKPAAAHLLCESLNQVGVPAVSSKLIERSVIQLVGTEWPDSFKDREGWHRSWWLERLPGFELEPGWLLRLVPPAIQVSLAYHIEPLSSAWVVDYLRRQLRAMRASNLTPGGHDDPTLFSAMPNAEALQRRVAANQESAFQVSTYLTVTSQGEDGLEAASQAIEAAAQASLVSLQRCTLRMRDARIASLPLGLDTLQRRRVLDTSSLSTFFPWLDADLQQETGLLVGTSRATGCPVLLDAFDAPASPMPTSASSATRGPARPTCSPAWR
jgi:hypothetical protein